MKESKIGKGFLASLTKGKLYLPKPDTKGKILTYGKNCVSFGFEELVINIYDRFSVKIGMGKCYFETGSDRNVDFIGQDEQQGLIKKIEFHEIIPMSEENKRNCENK